MGRQRIGDVRYDHARSGQLEQPVSFDGGPTHIMEEEAAHPSKQRTVNRCNCPAEERPFICVIVCLTVILEQILASRAIPYDGWIAVMKIRKHHYEGSITFCSGKPIHLRTDPRKTNQYISSERAVSSHQWFVSYDNVDL